MNFIEEINILEEQVLNESFTILKGNVPILFSAPHTMIQEREDGSVKLN